MSFVNEAILQSTMEGLISTLWREVLGIELTLPLRRMTYAEAMDKYGVDKPDLRCDLTLCDVTVAVGQEWLQDLRGRRRQRRHRQVPARPRPAEKLSRSMLDGLTDFAKSFGVKGVAFARVQEGGVWQARSRRASPTRRATRSTDRRRGAG